MKNLLLSLALIISANTWADMDYTCDVYATDRMSQFNKLANFHSKNDNISIQIFATKVS